MSAISAAIPPVVVYTVLDFLIPFFLRYAGTREAAGLVVMDLLEEQAPRTAEELGLAAEIIGFRHKALALIRDSENPGTPPAIVLQLSKTASALRRNEAAAQRKLDALRRARLAPTKQPVDETPAAEPAAPSPDPAPPPPAAAESPLLPAASAEPARAARIEAFMRHLTNNPPHQGDPVAVDDMLSALARGVAGATAPEPASAVLTGAGSRPH